jgi:hypothetical protein
MEEYQKPEIRSEKIEIGVYGLDYNDANEHVYNGRGKHKGWDIFPGGR